MTESLQLVETIRRTIDVITHRTFREHGRFVKAAGLSIPQFSILMQLHFHTQCGMSEVTNHMDISNAAASQLVEKLVQGGLVERDEDPNDRRAKQLKLTVKGEELVETSMAQRHQWVDVMLNHLNPGDLEKVADVMNILMVALQGMQEAEKPVIE